MPIPEQRFRQIHLDFHTSEDIAAVGSQFDPQKFADTLVRAHVDSINLFARCHHGWIYYDTKAHPERRHPHLTRNLLAEQITACHFRSIRTPIYTTVQWDRYTAAQHPEWLTMAADGTIKNNPPYDAGFYAFLCLNSPYRDFLKAHVKDMLEVLPAFDGFWFDILLQHDCVCPRCRAKMEAKGLDPSDPAVMHQFGLETLNEFCRDMSSYVRQFREDCSIFYNSGHVGPRHRGALSAFTHLELESLPGGMWGYLHFPLTARYARTLDLDYLCMTGKFHTAWGDFGSFRNPAQLQFECFRSLALAGKCGVGDQLHPTGRICQATYDLIGPVFAEVEEKEPWCRGARGLAEIAVLSPEEFTGELMPASSLGAVRMLQEGGHQFDVIDSQADFGRYRLLVLPDLIPASFELAAKLDAYVQAGGALIATHRSGLNPEGTAFALESLGVTLTGEAPYEPDFLLAKGDLARDLPAAELVMYMRGLQVEPQPGTEVLADVAVPYFNRGRRFCSHQHAPSSGEISYPGALRRGNAIYFMHPLFRLYNWRAPRWAKQLFLSAIDPLLPDPLVRTNAPTTAQVTLTEQPAESRWIVHLLHYIPERRGTEMDVIEDVVPLHDVAVSLKAPRPVRRVATAPEGEALASTEVDGRVVFTVPKVHGHQMIAVEME